MSHLKSPDVPPDLIVSKTPLRVSFLGGGSDVPSFYKKMNGGVVSTAIDKFVFVTAKWRRDSKIRLVTHSEQLFSTWHKISDPILRSVFQSLNWRGGVDVSIMSDVTSSGSGLGASSAVAVGLFNALVQLAGHFLEPNELAARAAHAEMIIAGREIGKQDAYPPAFGGLRHYRFLSNETVECRGLDLSPDVQAELSSWLMLLDSGYRRDASKTLATQRVLVSPVARDEVLARMVHLAEDLALDLERSDLSNVGNYFDEAWHLKERLGALDGKPELAEIYNRAKRCGALGAKILGAGGGGYFLFLTPPSAHAQLQDAFHSKALHKVSIHSEGSRADKIDYSGVGAS